MTQQPIAKVAFFIGTLSKGGAERAVSNITQRLSDQIDRTIILYGTENRIDYPVRGDLVYIDDIKKNTILNKLLSIFRRVRKLAQMKRANPDTVFISFLEYPNLINLLTAKQARTIISVRNHMSTKNSRNLKGLFWKLTIRLFYNRADQIIAVTQDIKQDLIDHFGIDARRIEVIYNYYQLDEIRHKAEEPLPADYEAIYQHPVVTTMGRMNWQKGQWHLIQAFQQVLKSRPEANLVILGEGHLETTLKQLAVNLGIADHVHFPGFAKNPYPFLARSSVFVLPSLVEGFPNALAEAMACGVPVIATDCHSGPREILAPEEYGLSTVSYDLDDSLDQRFGILLPDIKSLAASKEKQDQIFGTLLSDAIDRVLGDSALQMKIKTRSSVRINDFNIEFVIDLWENVILNSKSIQ